MAVKESLKKLEEELTDVPYDREEKSSTEGKEIIPCACSPSFSNLTEKEVRKILESEVYFMKAGKKIQNKIEIVKIERSHVYSYGLQTWTQKRQLYWQFKKYLFGKIDDQSFARMPEAWEIAVSEPEKIKPFTNHVQNIVVKHSECIQPCFACSNMSLIDCTTCGGNKKLIYYLNCRISWHNYKDEYMTEPHLIPYSKLKQAPGEMIYSEEDKKLNPVEYRENEEISEASDKYHKQHRKSSKKEKILMQKQFIKKTELFTVFYTYKNKVKKIFIYGDKRKKEVHIPYSFDSPSTISSVLACVFM